MSKIKEINEDAARWCEAIPSDQWSQSHDGGHRYGHMTTNLSECINGVLKGTRSLPITSLVQHTFFRLVEYFEKRKRNAVGLIQQGNYWSGYLTDHMSKNGEKASSHRVIAFNRQTGSFEVETMHSSTNDRGGHRQVVKLNEGTCTCGKFQALRFPCSHVMAACSYVSVDCFQYVDPCYRLDMISGCYNTDFVPIGDQEYWAQTPAPTILPDVRLLRPKGRPKSSRIRNEMDWTESSSSQRCARCHKEGHNQRTCTSTDQNG